MSRLPAILEMTGGKSRRQRVWEAIRLYAADGNGGLSEMFGGTKGTFTAEELAHTSKVEVGPVREYLKCLCAAGYIRIVDPLAFAPPGVRNIFLLLRDNGIEAPRVRRDGSEVTMGRGTEAMWAAMTALDSFDHWLIADIAQVKPGTAASYCQALGKAGFLNLLKPGKGKGKGGTASVWMVALSHRQKPRAPMITRLKAVYDPNTHQIVWAEGANEAADAVEIGEVVQ